MIRNDPVSNGVITFIQQTLPEELDVNSIKTTEMETTVEVVVNVQETPQQSNNIIVVHDKTTKENRMMPNIQIQQTETTVIVDSRPEPQYQVFTQETLPQQLRPTLNQIREDVSQKYFQGRPIKVEDIKVKEQDGVKKMQVVFVDEDTQERKVATVLVGDDGTYIIEEERPFRPIRPGVLPIQQEREKIKIVSCYDGKEE